MSKLEAWVEKAEARHTDPEPGQGAAPRKITVRIPAYDYFRLEKMAEVANVSRSRCAEELLEAAIADAYEQMALPEEPGEFHQWMTE